MRDIDETKLRDLLTRVSWGPGHEWLSANDGTVDEPVYHVCCWFGSDYADAVLKLIDPMGWESRETREAFLEIVPAAVNAIGPLLDELKRLRESLAAVKRERDSLLYGWGSDD